MVEFFSEKKKKKNPSYHYSANISFELPPAYPPPPFSFLYICFGYKKQPEYVHKYIKYNTIVILGNYGKASDQAFQYIQNTREIKRMLFNKTEQDKTCTFSM